MDTGVSTSPGTSLFRLIKCASMCFISACNAPETVCGRRRYICIPPPPFIFPADVIVPPHQMCVCLTFCPLFLPPRGAGGGDGKSRDGRPPRETEAPAPTQRALPVPPAGVFTCHAHQVNGLQSILFFISSKSSITSGPRL